MSQNGVLQVFISKLQRLKQGNTAFGKAPHKPVLLLSVIHQIERGHILGNHIYLTPDLIAEFIETFRLLGNTGNRPEFTLPFYHLTNEGFWHLQPKSDKILRGYVKSINVLNELVDYAYFDEPLFALMQNFETRQILKNTLLNPYFADKKAVYLSLQSHTPTYIQNLENYILNEPNMAYQTAPSRLSRDMASVKDEDEQFVRGSLFKKWIPKLYNNTCSITRMRVTSSHGYQLIDACHIKPISLSYDDTVSNGLALCPNLHRAFDRGIIGVDEKYRVVVSRHIKEETSVSYSLKALEGTKLYLPMAEVHFPRVENFLWHLGERFER